MEQNNKKKILEVFPRYMYRIYISSCEVWVSSKRIQTSVFRIMDKFFCLKSRICRNKNGDVEYIRYFTRRGYLFLVFRCSDPVSHRYLIRLCDQGFSPAQNRKMFFVKYHSYLFFQTKFYPVESFYVNNGFWNFLRHA